MPSQRQRRRTPPLAYDTIITFALSGRTTLSEHLPSENIDVPLTIASRSPRLLTILERHTSGHPNVVTIPLPNIDPAGFKLFLDYLTSARKRPLSYAFPTTTHCSLRECIDLIYAHIVGGTLEASDFQDYIMDEMSKVLSPKQSLDQKILDVVFVDRKASDILKKFVIDKMFAEDRKLVNMLRGGYEDTSGKAGKITECVYHVHGKGDCCRPASVPEISQRSGQVKKPWHADDDPELQAMAEHCLGHTKNASIGKMHQDRMNSKRGERIVQNHRRRSSVPMHTSELDYHDMTEPLEPYDLYMSPESSSSNETEKPLPALPTSSNSSSVSLSSHESPSMLQTSLEHATASTNGAQSESRARQHPGASADANVRDIVAECLDRFIRSSSTMETTYRDNAFGGIGTIKRRAVSSDLPLSQGPDLPRKSPSNWQLNRIPSELLRSSTGGVACSKEDLDFLVAGSLMPPLYLPPLVKRKAVPPRGDDWVAQWDRLHALRGTQGFGQRRSSEKEKRWLLKDLADSIQRTEHEA